MGSRFVPVTDPDKVWEYRQAGLLYFSSSRRPEWRAAKFKLTREASDEVVKGGLNQYAILVESEEVHPTNSE
mgnify:CR=1 FL=1